MYFHVRRPWTGDIYGGERSTLLTASAMKERGISPVMFLTAKDRFASEIAQRGIPLDVCEVFDPVHGIRAASWTGKLRKLKDLVRVNHRVYRRVREDGIGIVHGAELPSFFCSYVGAKLAGARFVLHLRAGNSAQRTRLFEAVAFLLSDRTLAVSRTLHEQMVSTTTERLRPWVARKMEAVFNGFDFAFMDELLTGKPRQAYRKRFGYPEGKTIGVILGSLRPVKGQLRFLAEVMPPILAALPDFHLILIGGVLDEQYAESCRRVVRERGWENSVTFLPYMPVHDAYERLFAGDIAILPSEIEGLPRAVIEAQGLALPVVATAIVGTTDAALDGETAFLVPLARLADMAGPIIRLARDPSLRATMGQAGAAFVRREFSIRRNVDRIAAIYRELTGSDPPQG